MIVLDGKDEEVFKYILSLCLFDKVCPTCGAGFEDDVECTYCANRDECLKNGIVLKRERSPFNGPVEHYVLKNPKEAPCKEMAHFVNRMINKMEAEKNGQHNEDGSRGNEGGNG